MCIRDSIDAPRGRPLHALAFQKPQAFLYGLAAPANCNVAHVNAPPAPKPAPPSPQSCAARPPPGPRHRPARSLCRRGIRHAGPHGPPPSLPDRRDVYKRQVLGRHQLHQERDGEQFGQTVHRRELGSVQPSRRTVPSDGRNHGRPVERGLRRAASRNLVPLRRPVVGGQARRAARQVGRPGGGRRVHEGRHARRDLSLIHIFHRKPRCRYLQAWLPACPPAWRAAA